MEFNIFKYHWLAIKFLVDGKSPVTNEIITKVYYWAYFGDNVDDIIKKVSEIYVDAIKGNICEVSNIRFDGFVKLTENILVLNNMEHWYRTLYHYL